MTDKAAITPADVARTDKAEGLSYLESLPRRLVTLYLPLVIILLVLLFPFYWMALTAIKPDEQLINMDQFNPFWTTTPTLKHINKLLFESAYPRWLVVLVGTLVAALAIWIAMKLLKWTLWLLFFAILIGGIFWTLLLVFHAVSA